MSAISRDISTRDSNASLTDLTSPLREPVLSSGAMSSPPPVRLRTIALPVEHGGWGFLAEPILLGLALAPSWAGLAIGLATLAAFLMRHPAKLYWRNRHRLDLSPRFRIARRFALLYAGLALGGFAVALALGGACLYERRRPAALGAPSAPDRKARAATAARLAAAPRPASSS